MPKCEFGCDQEASIQFKSSGKWCCSPSPNSCPGKRERDSTKKKGKPTHKGGRRGFYPGFTPWQTGKTYEEMYGAVGAAEKKAILAKRASQQDHKKWWASQSDETKQEYRERFDKIRTSGYKQGSGHGLNGWYKGYWCDISWELAFVIHCIDHGVPIERNRVSYEYEYEGRTHKYYPDFIVGGSLVEIKGIWTKKERAKIDQCPVPLKVIDKGSIQEYLDYAISKHGRKFTSVYEKVTSK